MIIGPWTDTYILFAAVASTKCVGRVEFGLGYINRYGAFKRTIIANVKC